MAQCYQNNENITAEWNELLSGLSSDNFNSFVEYDNPAIFEDYLTNGSILLLRNKLMKGKLSTHEVLQILTTISPTVNLNLRNLNTFLDKILKQQQKLKKNKKDKIEFNEYLEHRAKLPVKSTSSDVSLTQVDSNNDLSLNKPPELVVDDVVVKLDLMSVSHTDEKRSQDYDIKINKICSEFQNLTTKPEETESNNLQKEVVRLTKRCKLQAKAIKSMKRTSYYKRLQRRERYLNTREINNKKIIFNQREEIRTLRSDVALEQCSQRTKRKLLQTLLSKRRRKIDSLEKSLEARDGEIARLRLNISEKDAACTNLQRTIDIISGDRAIDTRVNESSVGKFNDGTRQCCMELVGQQLGMKKIPQVISIVSKNMFDVDISKNSLPSATTISNFVSEAHFIAKRHVTETLLKSSKFDLHFDGTCRDKNKILDFEVTTDNFQTLTLGFMDIAREDSKTVVDTTISVFKDLAQTMVGNKEVFENLISRLSSLVGDRSAVVKLAHEKLNEWRKEYLDSVGQKKDDGLLYFYCMAHFLLGLSSQAEKDIKTFESELVKERGSLGRDALAEFKYWRCSESCVLRLLRTLCSALGPRGDEKSGCRARWLSYLDLSDKKSKILDFRSNRFNCIFAGAAAAHYHRADIIDFFANGYVGNSNQLLLSVLADIRSIPLSAGLRALGIFSVHLSTPFWKMIQSNSVHVTDLHLYINPLWNFLKKMSQDGKALLDRELPPVFADFEPKKDEIYDSLYNVRDEGHDELTSEFLEIICSSSLVVTARQLGDYLIGGKYGQERPDISERTKHTQKTNLLGENDFGDFDFSKKQKPTATTQHHSSVIMLKRNKPFHWLNSLDSDSKSLVMKDARKYGPILKQEARGYVAEVKTQKKTAVLENYQIAQAKELKNLNEKQSIIDDVHEHGGPCRCREDLNSLLEAVSESEKIALLVTEIKYYSKVLNVKAPRDLFKMSKQGKKLAVGELKNNLEQIINYATPSASVSYTEYTRNTQKVKDVISQNLEQLVDSNHRKRKSNIEICPTPAKKSKESRDSEINLSGEDSDDETNLQHVSYEIGNLKENVYIAVAYEDRWYPGLVTKLVDDETAIVNFLHPTVGGAFRWTSEIAPVEKKFVIANELSILPVGAGRTWQIEDIENIEQRFSEYARLFF